MKFLMLQSICGQIQWQEALKLETMALLQTLQLEFLPIILGYRQALFELGLAEIRAEEDECKRYSVHPDLRGKGLRVLKRF